MGAKERSIEVSVDDGALVKITVRRANALIGMRRFQLMLEGDDANNAEKEAGHLDRAMGTLRVVSYPDLVSCTISAEGIPWPITADQFAELDEELVNQWAEIAYAVNPQWTAKRPEDGETAAKKVPV